MVDLEVDYTTLCLDGSKECTKIHEYAYVDLDEQLKLDIAHGAFAILSFIGSVGPMFIVNAWIKPTSRRYQLTVV